MGRSRLALPFNSFGPGRVAATTSGFLSGGCPGGEWPRSGTGRGLREDEPDRPARSPPIPFTPRSRTHRRVLPRWRRSLRGRSPASPPRARRRPVPPGSARRTAPPGRGGGVWRRGGAGSRGLGPRCWLHCLRGLGRGPGRPGGRGSPVPGGSGLVRSARQALPPPARGGGARRAAGRAPSPPGIVRGAGRAGPAGAAGAPRPLPPGGAAAARPAEGTVTMWPLPSRAKMARAAPGAESPPSSRSVRLRRSRGARCGPGLRGPAGSSGRGLPAGRRSRKTQEILKSVPPAPRTRDTRGAGASA